MSYPSKSEVYNQNPNPQSPIPNPHCNYINIIKRKKILDKNITNHDKIKFS